MSAIDPQFVNWVKAASILARIQIVIEFVDKHPFEHNDPKLAPVGDYLFTPVDQLRLAATMISEKIESIREQ
jgi:hypothetical protein